MATPEERIVELGLELPEPATPVGSYVTAKQTGNVLYVSGHGPIDTDGKSIRGKVGDALDVDQGYYAARRCGLGLLATMRQHLGSLDRVTEVIKLLGMVNCPPEFGKQPQVINGASDLMVEVFGDAGRHARSAVGMGSLPFDIAVEVELIVEISG
jgi:enamine deaminase RidA (YjgF/YER057c/UK114 family)